MDRGTCKLLIATTNQGKFHEIAKILAGCPFDLVSLADLGIHSDVPETGLTFEDNAILKADAYSRLSGMLTLADDSGLEVGALGGEPGVRSARYAGPSASDSQKITFLIKKLKTVGGSQWKARFKCVIAVMQPGGPPKSFSGECEGRIIEDPKGGNGFGYDPVFFIPELGKTMAELSPAKKNQISHRAKAVALASEGLKAYNDWIKT